ncbi:hypothetical protein G9A89_000543 [Geosiphon pyriformis]|nr:hypothetical protein G9A89_000543 [Geosiphon pyriformis]
MGPHIRDETNLGLVLYPPWHVFNMDVSMANPEYMGVPLYPDRLDTVYQWDPPHTMDTLSRIHKWMDPQQPMGSTTNGIPPNGYMDTPYTQWIPPTSTRIKQTPGSALDKQAPTTGYPDLPLLQS